jgi:hypothetical protein
VAAVLLLYAISRERPRLLVPAVILTAPVLTYLAPLAILAALPRMPAKPTSSEPPRAEASAQVDSPDSLVSASAS